MKLVDILARELKVWPDMPEGGTRLEQDTNNAVIEGDGFGTCDIFMLSERCEDFKSSPHVDRSQWQAAVDALKAEVRPTESMALHHQKVGRITRQWSGEGLPPVGAVCEFMKHNAEPVSDGQWTVGDIRYVSDCYVIIGGEGCEHAHHPRNCSFRPVRTPEQIAAEEIQKIRDEIKWQKPQLGPCPVEQMYMLGYRKFEIVDN